MARVAVVVVNDVGGIEHAFLDEKSGIAARPNVRDQQDHGGDRSTPRTRSTTPNICPQDGLEVLKKILSPGGH